MTEINRDLFIGGDADCNVCSGNHDFSIVHACKTCHLKILKYSGSLPDMHPSYLIYENGSHLYLNMIDAQNELQSKFTLPIFKNAMNFINREIKNKKVLVHCNFGMSRSPSIGMAYLASRGAISNKSPEKAITDFLKLYPQYSPGNGIMLFMKHNWETLMKQS